MLHKFQWGRGGEENISAKQTPLLPGIKVSFSIQKLPILHISLLHLLFLTVIQPYRIFYLRVGAAGLWVFMFYKYIVSSSTCTSTSLSHCKF